MDLVARVAPNAAWRVAWYAMMGSAKNKGPGVLMRNSRLLFLGRVVAGLLIPFAAAAQKPAWQPPPGNPSIELWPNGAPGAVANSGPEVDLSPPNASMVAGKPLIRLGNVSRPTITLFTAKENPSGAAVVVFPGGSYHALAIDLEGTEVCQWLNSIHVTCILLKYRVPDSGPLPESSAALQDAQRALGLVRQYATEWKINPQRIGALGFSAGAHLAAALGTHFEQRMYEPVDSADKLSCRPDFAVIIYPGYLSMEEKNYAGNPEIHPTAQNPPSFILQTEDDPVHVENSTLYFLLLKNAKVPAELHIYAEGGHGYGMRRTALPVTGWSALVETWLQTIKILPQKP
jgi:acetyl esterase/lipase